MTQPKHQRQRQRQRKPNMSQTMKLFVVGSKSPNPQDWSIWDEVAIVIAENKSQAAEIARDGDWAAITEIPLTEAKLLIQNTEPDWGKDV